MRRQTVSSRFSEMMKVASAPAHSSLETRRCRQPRITVSSARGVTLVDVLVGLTVAMLSLVIVYQAFVVLQTIHRNAAAAADTQSGGLFALFALAAQAESAGAGIAAAARWLDTCPADSDVT